METWGEGQWEETSTDTAGYTWDPGYSAIFGRHEWMSWGGNSELTFTVC